MSDLTWQQERSMTPLQYKRILKDLGINIAQAGRFLGVSERTSHRYIRGDTDIPEAHVLLLRAVKELGQPPVVPKWVRDAR